MNEDLRCDEANVNLAKLAGAANSLTHPSE